MAGKYLKLSPKGWVCKEMAAKMGWKIPVILLKKWVTKKVISSRGWFWKEMGPKSRGA